MDELIRMLQLSAQSFHCSQILLFMGLEAQGKTNPDLIRAMAGLAEGLGFSGGTCGVLTGGACLIGLYAGKGRPEEEQHSRLNLMIHELVEWFVQRSGPSYGGTRCSDILADDARNKGKRCPGILTETYGKVKSLLKDNGLDLAVGRT